MQRPIKARVQGYGSCAGIRCKQHKTYGILNSHFEEKRRSIRGSPTYVRSFWRLRRNIHRSNRVPMKQAPKYFLSAPVGHPALVGPFSAVWTATIARKDGRFLINTLSEVSDSQVFLKRPCRSPGAGWPVLGCMDSYDSEKRRSVTRRSLIQCYRFSL